MLLGGPLSPSGPRYHTDAYFVTLRRSEFLRASGAGLFFGLEDKWLGSSLLSVGARGFPANFWNCRALGEATPARRFGSPALTQSPNTMPL